jgi:hypothetical protein
MYWFSFLCLFCLLNRYKVAKVEQVETPLAMAKRQDKSGARDATVC